MGQVLQKIREWVGEIKVHPLLVLAAWVFFTFQVLRIGYLQAAYKAGQEYKRYVGPGGGNSA